MNCEGKHLYYHCPEDINRWANCGKFKHQPENCKMYKYIIISFNVGSTHGYTIYNDRIGIREKRGQGANIVGQ